MSGRLLVTGLLAVALLLAAVAWWLRRGSP